MKIQLCIMRSGKKCVYFGSDGVRLQNAGKYNIYEPISRRHVYWDGNFYLSDSQPGSVLVLQHSEDYLNEDAFTWLNSKRKPARVESIDVEGVVIVDEDSEYWCNVIVPARPV